MIPDDIVVLEPTTRRKGSTGARKKKPVIGMEEEIFVLEQFENNDWPAKLHFTQAQFWALLDRCPDGDTPLSDKPDDDPDDGWEEPQYKWVGLWQKTKKHDLWWRPNRGEHVTDDGQETTLRGFSVATLKDEEEPRFQQAKDRLEELRAKRDGVQETAEAETEEVEVEKPKPKRKPRKKKS